MAKQLHTLQFTPFPGLHSPHAQTALSCMTPGGKASPSDPLIFPLKDGDKLYGAISTPDSWTPSSKTVVLIHGLGGSHDSSYIVRVGRKCYEKGYRTVRLNMRGCGKGNSYASRPYHGGVSHDLYDALKQLKALGPDSPIYVIGYSLGGNIAVKLAGELRDDEKDLVAMTIAICPPIDLGQTAAILSRPNHRFYNNYYIKYLAEQTAQWTGHLKFKTIYEFDQQVTTPNWNFKNPNEYYNSCSGRYFLGDAKHPCRLIFSEDDPFIDYRCCIDDPHSDDVSFWVSRRGGHMGFFGWSDTTHGYYWLDSLLLKWLQE